MTTLVVVNHPRDWPFDIAGMQVVTAGEYLGDPAYGDNPSARVLNLCPTDRYQGRGTTSRCLPRRAVSGRCPR
jgi:hypothetical protein